MDEPLNKGGSDVLAEVLRWSASRADWQRDALRRIVLRGGITDQDLEELQQLCRAAHGVGSTAPGVLAAVPLAASHLPGGGAGGADSLALCAVKGLKHVNRIAKHRGWGSPEIRPWPWTLAATKDRWSGRAAG